VHFTDDLSTFIMLIF